MDRVLKQSFTINYNYDIFFTEDLFALSNRSFGDFLLHHRNPEFKQKVLFVIDESVWNSFPHLGAAIIAYFKGLTAIELISDPVIIAGGEYCKNSPVSLDSIVQAVDHYGVDRHSYIVGIGGGALLDLVGYAAAISHRGIRHIRIPTTVLSQNDSGVGVKNSVNYQGKKNFLGTFTPAIAVFNDFNFLQTLSDRFWVAGISEAIKVALIKDLDFFEWIEKNASLLATHGSQEMKDLIFHCADLHLTHIRNGDPFELGSSRPLDFGHWSAHKLEQMTNFELLHGEAVAIGLAIDVYYSYLIGNLTETQAERVIKLIHTLGLPIYHPMLDSVENRKVLLAGLLDFQEHLGGRLTIVLLEKLGKGKDYHELDFTLIHDTLDFLKICEPTLNNLHEIS